jgi:hypothetical protein
MVENTCSKVMILFKLIVLSFYVALDIFEVQAKACLRNLAAGKAPRDHVISGLHSISASSCLNHLSLPVPLSIITDNVSFSRAQKTPIEPLTNTRFLTAQCPSLPRGQLSLAPFSPTNTAAPQTILYDRDQSETTHNRPAMADGHQTTNREMPHVRLDAGAGGRGGQDITTLSEGLERIDCWE